MNRRLHAAAVYLTYMAGDGFLMRLTTTIYSVFVIVRLELDPFRLVLLGTILEVSYFLFEIPTGVIADTVSRRLSIVIGLVGSGVGFLLLGVSTTFGMAAVSQVIWGISATFTDGADVAWLTDEVGESEARRLYVRGEQASLIASLAGIALSVALASIWLALPIIATGAGFVVLGVVLAVVMPEEGFTRPERVEGMRLHRGMISTLRNGIRQVRAHHVLVLILGTAALHGASTEGFDRLADFHLLRDIGLPSFGNLDRVVWFAILDGVGLLAGLGAIGLVRRRLHLEGHEHVAKVLAVVDLLLVAGVVAFGLTGRFWFALSSFWLVAALRSAREPMFTAWINQGLDPATRATINSMGGQADAIGQTAGGPVLGLIGNASVPLALVTSGLLRLPSMALYVRAVKRGTVGTVPPERMDEELTLPDD
jgi:DHA3 family tetracycline resistance protein-like MFS transporter